MPPEGAATKAEPSTTERPCRGRIKLASSLSDVNELQIELHRHESENL